MGWLRPILSRLLGNLVAGLATWLALRYNIVLDESSQAALVASALTAFGIIYTLIHRLLDRKLNPADAASPKLARQSQTTDPVVRPKVHNG